MALSSDLTKKAFNGRLPIFRNNAFCGVNFCQFNALLQEVAK